MRRVGPQPPEPDWDRLDFRGLNGSRQAWGYLSPNDEVIVTNVAIIKRMYVFEEEKQETPSQSPPSNDKRLHLTR